MVPGSRFFNSNNLTAFEAAQKMLELPLLYIRLPENLQQDRFVVRNAVATCPALMECLCFPQSAWNDPTIQKIAFVAAHFLQQPPIYQTLIEKTKETHTLDQLKRDLDQLDQDLMQTTYLPLPSKESELWTLPSFYLHGPRVVRLYYQQFAPSEIKTDIPLAIQLIKSGTPAIYDQLAPELQSNASVLDAKKQAKT